MTAKIALLNGHKNVFFPFQPTHMYIRKHIGTRYIPHTNIADKPRYNWRAYKVNILKTNPKFEILATKTQRNMVIVCNLLLPLFNQ